jgi:hypothetical protein
MRLEPWMCFAGVEIANQARTATYLNAIGQPGGTMPIDCACSAIDTGFVHPLDDPAPWYEPTRPESLDFFGFYASEATLNSVHGRAVTPTGGLATVLSPLKSGTRTVLVSGLLLARSAEGMAYGQRWLTEVLRGSPCYDGCGGDDLVILPACPESDDYDVDSYFRTLMNAGVVDGPVYTPVISKENLVMRGAFSIAAGIPYLHHPATRCVDAETISYGEELSCALTTPQWMGDGTFIIDITNIDTSATTDITITGRLSLDGSCPVDAPGTSVPPSFTYTIPTLEPEDRIVIDGARRQVLHYDASAKFATNGLRHLAFDGPFRWADVGPCSTLCVTITAEGGNAEVTVDSLLREL